MSRLLVLLVCLSLAGPVFAQTYGQPQGYNQQTSHLDFEEGVAAAQAGNYAEAYCIWKPLADLGHAEAQYRLGWLYAKGLGLAINETAAVNLWKLAANLGHADAMFRLGWAYEHGEGVVKDLSRAMGYYMRAARLGQEDAIEFVQLMLMRDNREIVEGIGKLLRQNPRALGKYTAIGVPKANVRRGPNKNARLITTLSQGDELVVLGRSGNWLRIWLVEQQRFGWIFKRLVMGFEK